MYECTLSTAVQCSEDCAQQLKRPALGPKIKTPASVHWRGKIHPQRGGGDDQDSRLASWQYAARLLSCGLPADAVRLPGPVALYPVRVPSG